VDEDGIALDQLEVELGKLGGEPLWETSATGPGRGLATIASCMDGTVSPADLVVNRTNL
jgi:hypothetical protein